MNREEAIQFLKKIHEDRLYDGKLDYVEHNKMLEVIEMLSSLIAKPTPDPDTGLVPCGCGGEVEQEDFHDGFFPYSRVTCRGCGTETTRCRCTTEEAHKMARIGWNASHGYTAPSLPGAIGPEPGGEGTSHE